MVIIKNKSLLLLLFKSRLKRYNNKNIEKRALIKGNIAHIFITYLFKALSIAFNTSSSLNGFKI